MPDDDKAEVDEGMVLDPDMPEDDYDYDDELGQWSEGDMSDAD